MQHDDAHELKQNAALRMLASYMKNLRAAVQTRYELAPGDPVVDVEALLGELKVDDPVAQPLNRPVLTLQQAEEVRRSFFSEKALADKGDGK